MTILPRIFADSLTTVILSETRRPGALSRGVAAELAFPNPVESPTTFFRNETFRALAQMQFFSLWCWNAVGAAVASFYITKLGDTGDMEEFQHQCSNLQYADPPIAPRCELKLTNSGPQIGSFIPFMLSHDPIAKIGATAYDVTGKPELIVDKTGLVVARRERYREADRPNEADVAEVIEAISQGHVVVMHLDTGRTNHVVTIYGTKVKDGERIFLIADPERGFQEWPELPEDGWVWKQSIFFDRV